MTKERDIEKEYFYQLEKSLTASALYKDDAVERIDVLNMIYFKKSNFNIIDKLIKASSFTSLVNFNFETRDEGLELMEIILVKDTANALSIAYMVDESELFSDKYLYYIQRLTQEEYEALLKCENHKGYFNYQRH